MGQNGQRGQSRVWPTICRRDLRSCHSSFVNFSISEREILDFSFSLACASPNRATDGEWDPSMARTMAFNRSGCARCFLKCPTSLHFKTQQIVFGRSKRSDQHISGSSNPSARLAQFGFNEWVRSLHNNSWWMLKAEKLSTQHPVKAAADEIRGRVCLNSLLRVSVVKCPWI